MTRSTRKRSSCGLKVYASDLRHYCYCPRVIYWRRVYRAAYKVGRVAARKGVEERVKWVSQLEEFRGCKAEFDVRLESERLVGVLDVLVYCDNSVFPVEVKRGLPECGHELQLAAYALMMEESGVKVTVGYLYYPGRELRRVSIDDGLKRRVLRAVEEILDIICEGRMPEPTRDRWKCRVCDHQAVCRGV